MAAKRKSRASFAPAGNGAITWNEYTVVNPGDGSSTLRTDVFGALPDAYSVQFWYVSGNGAPVMGLSADTRMFDGDDGPVPFASTVGSYYQLVDGRGELISRSPLAIRS